MIMPDVVIIIIIIIFQRLLIQDHDRHPGKIHEHAAEKESGQVHTVSNGEPHR